MRGIEIVAVIHLPEFAMANKTLAWLPLADQIAALEQIAVAEPAACIPCGENIRTRLPLRVKKSGHSHI